MIGFYVEIEVRSSLIFFTLKVGKVVFKSKPAEHSWNSSGIRLLRDAGSKAVVLENLKLKIEVVLFTRVLNFIRIELS